MLSGPARRIFIVVVFSPILYSRKFREVKTKSTDRSIDRLIERAYTVAVDDGAADERAASAAEGVMQRVEDHLRGGAHVDRHRLSHVRAAGRPHRRVRQPCDHEQQPYSYTHHAHIHNCSTVFTPELNYLD